MKKSFNKMIFPEFNGIDLFITRIGGSGIGNLLFVYARAYKMSLQDQNSILLNPTWNCIKPKWIFRLDFSRNYINIIHNDSLFRRVWLRIRLHLATKNQRIIVRGLANNFEDLKGFQDKMHSRLLFMLRRREVAIYDNYNYKFIGMHIRTGDFQSNHVDVHKPINQSNEQVPLVWFKKCIECLSPENRIIIFTDAKEGDSVFDLACNGNVEFFSATNNPLTTLLVMSRSEMLIASNSSFSGWASFLGQMPSYYFPGTINSLTCGSEIGKTLPFSEISKSAFLS